MRTKKAGSLVVEPGMLGVRVRSLVMARSLTVLLCVHLGNKRHSLLKLPLNNISRVHTWGM